MFGELNTPARSGTWPRYNTYNSAVPPPTSTPTFPHRPLPPTFTQQHPGLSTPANSAILSSSRPTLSSSPALQPSSPGETLQTPVPRRHLHPAAASAYSLASPPTTAFQDLNTEASPLMTRMASYPNTPSPPASYGINGGIIVNQHGDIVQSGSHHHQQHPSVAACNPLIPSHDVFNSTKSLPMPARPVLRPSLSHNGVYQTPSPSSWSRRMMNPMSTNTTHPASSAGVAGSAISSSATSSAVPISGAAGASNERQRASTADLSASAPSGPAVTAPIPIHGGSSHLPHPQHEASLPSASSTFATLSSSAPTTHPSSYPPPPPPPQHTQTVPFQHHHDGSNPAPGSYQDDYSFSSSSYPGSAYDSSFSSAHTASSWPTNPSPHHLGNGHYLPHPQYYHQMMPHPHPMYPVYATGKEAEPILAPGEVPAPRPPMSYAALIGEALLLAPAPHHLYVAEISESVKNRYAFYRQNPTKIYNGVRHQTSMCKAFVKLPRPFGDQSGGARKWAIRAGCETWFSNGGYHPPGTSPTPAPAVAHGKKGGKAKSTARAKQLAIGVTSPPVSHEKRPIIEDAPWSAGPSSGPAYDGTGKPFNPFQQPQPYAQQPHHYPPGYHYIPLNGNPAHPPHPQFTGHGVQPMFVPVWGPYGAPPPPASAPSAPWSGRGDESTSSPENWRDEHKFAPSEHGSQYSFDDHTRSPISLHGNLSPQGESPETR